MVSCGAAASRPSVINETDAKTKKGNIMGLKFKWVCTINTVLSGAIDVWALNKAVVEARPTEKEIIISCNTVFYLTARPSGKVVAFGHTIRIERENKWFAVTGNVNSIERDGTPKYQCSYNKYFRDIRWNSAVIPAD